MKSNGLRAIVMAGGMGTRLRPLTDHIPKPLAPIGDESAVSTVLKMLARAGVDNAALTLMYKGDMIEKALGSTCHGISLSYIKETEPLGTAGSVKNARTFLSGCGTFIVASADAVCDFDLSGALEYHRMQNAKATLVITRVQDPSEYGIVLGDFDESGKGKIERFIEKPPIAQAYSDLVNTGIYILSEDILKMIPEGQKFDFARDLFPALIGDGLFGYTALGYWCDVGDLCAYRRCLYDAAAGKIKTADSCRITGERNIVGGGCRIASSAAVSGSVLHASVTVCEDSSVHDSLVCENTLIEENVTISSGAVIGAGSMIGAGSSVSGAKLSAGSIVPPGSVILAEVDKPLPFYRGKLYGLDKNDIPFLAEALLPMISEKKAGIMWAGERPPQADAFLNVLGERAAILGEGYTDLAVFAARNFEFAFVVFIDRSCDMTFFDPNGILVSREFERSVISNFKKNEPEKAKSFPTDLSEELMSKYLDALEECAAESFSGISVSLSAEAHPLAHTLRRLGAIPREENENGYHIELSDNGTLLSVSEYAEGNVFHIGASHIAALLLLQNAGYGEIVALPCRAPKMLDHILDTVGAVPDRYPENDASKKSPFRNIKFWLYDGSAATVSFLSSLRQNGSSVSEEIKKLPEFVFIKKAVKANDAAKLMRTFAKEHTTGDGIRIDFSYGSVCFIPQSKTEALLFCDAESADDAEEMILELTQKYELQEI